MAAARELGAFLRARREQTRPEDLGLEPGTRRRVDGLRREEVAVLAGLSTDYYQRLEQGRSARPSDAALDSISDALDLDATEREHIGRLARTARRPAPRPRRTSDKLPRGSRILLEATDLPAFIVSQHLDVLAWNPLAAELLGDPTRIPAEERNVLMMLFHEDAGLRYPSCEAMARDYVGMLRTAISRDPEHPRAITVVGALSVRSAEFRKIWARHDVRDRINGGKTLRHPRIGEIDIERDAYPVPRTADASMIVITARPGSEDALHLLGTLVANRPAAAHGSVR
ncbi:helix-turn-helix transcriptional regulator [Homoserinibacter sp. YIM 151385]|uniref:helix-turn-helix transcriptional regulator n=1 Tax=Homoserinibacter sp. YIM 151385 TaxID=2985506 RepID=UPI0022F03CC3|nr:helix-turn-helix transcriptional regulator [Homoserinibacter sp. YIM 151385]WBU38800.1 helix-turn-helix transcriptional regulator [Homoserinibacter sp. YIM 151385]